MNSIKPSGIKHKPKFFPAFARASITSAMLSNTYLDVILLAKTSSPMSVTFGWVYKLHSRVMCEAARPIRRMKCQYFFAESAS